MKTVHYPANERGHANQGWLVANHYFSFANWYNPEKIQFGALRVLNDDYVAPKMGFGKHPHDNMEIITIPFEGKLKHSDSMNNEGIIQSGEVQVMSAGSGVYHSEVNPDHNEAVKLFQIWIFPHTKNVEPRYDQRKFDWKKENELTQIISPINTDDAGMKVHQHAWLNLGSYQSNQELKYNIQKTGNGVFVVNISGELEVNGHTLNTRDAIGCWDTDSIQVKTKSKSEFLLIDVPML
jgi:quercetin 2,3-dioxygenase